MIMHSDSDGTGPTKCSGVVRRLGYFFPIDALGYHDGYHTHDGYHNVNVSPSGQWSEPMYPSKWNVSYALGYSVSLTRK